MYVYVLICLFMDGRSIQLGSDMLVIKFAAA